MARPSPAVGRVVAVLNFLAAHPDDGFTLSELARHVDLNKATAHSMLNALADAGYVLRHPTRLIYTLGPALVALGNAVAGSSPAVDFARDEMRALAGRFELECLATTAVADEMVIVARSGVPSRVATVDELVQVGRRLPLVPPLGTVFKAWAGDDANAEAAQGADPPVQSPPRRKSGNSRRWRSERAGTVYLRTTRSFP